MSTDRVRVQGGCGEGGKLDLNLHQFSFILGYPIKLTYSEIFLISFHG